MRIWIFTFKIYNIWASLSSSFLLIHFSLLVVVTQMTVRTQPTVEKSWAEIIAEYRWYTRLGYSCPIDIISQIIFVLMVGLKISPSYSDDAMPGRSICSNDFLGLTFDAGLCQWCFQLIHEVYVVLGPICSLLSQSSSPSRMIRGRRVGIILETWPTHRRRRQYIHHDRIYK